MELPRIRAHVHVSSLSPLPLAVAITYGSNCAITTYDSWDVPLLGVVPDEPYLARPALIDLEKIFKTKLLAGFENRRHPHYSIKDTIMAATGDSTGNIFTAISVSFP